MADRNDAVSVGTTATRLDTASKTDYKRGSDIAVRNVGSVTVYLGSASVTTANGFPLAPNESHSETLEPSGSLYGIVASGTCAVRVRETGV